MHRLLLSLLIAVCGLVFATLTTVAKETCSVDPSSTSRDISCWDFDKALPLDGNWEASIGIDFNRISDDSLAAREWRVMDIAKRWAQSGIPVNNQVVTYRLSLTVGEQNEPLLLFPGEAYMALRVFVRDQAGEYIKIYANASDEDFFAFEAGTMGQRFVSLPDLPEETVLILQVENGSYADGGLWRLPVLGNHKSILLSSDRMNISMAMLIGGFILLGIINISFWLAKRDERSQLYLGLISLVLSIRLLETERLLNVLNYDLEVFWFWRIGWWTMFVLAILWLFYLANAFPHPKLSRYVRYMAIVPALAFVFSLPEPDFILPLIGQPMRYYVIAFILISAYIIGRALFLKENTSRFLMIGLLVLSVGALIDTIGQALGYRINLLGFAFLFFVLSLTINFNRSYVRALRLSEAQADELEQEVQQRVAELTTVTQKLEEHSRTDTLTGLPTRAVFEARYEDELRRQEITGQQVAVALFEPDHFKQINETFGHQVGDDILIYLSSKIQQGLRDTDLVARLGGEKFVAVIPTRDVEGTYETLDRVRRTIEYGRFELSDGTVLSPTIRAGLTSVGEGDTIHSAIRRATELCDLAKQNGRNRIEIG